MPQTKNNTNAQGTQMLFLPPPCVFSVSIKENPDRCHCLHQHTALTSHLLPSTPLTETLGNWSSFGTSICLSNLVEIGQSLAVQRRIREMGTQTYTWGVQSPHVPREWRPPSVHSSASFSYSRLLQHMPQFLPPTKGKLSFPSSCGQDIAKIFKLISDAIQGHITPHLQLDPTPWMHETWI